MRTQYEIMIDEIASALEDHSYNIEWYFDFDEQRAIPLIEDCDSYPEEGHKVIRIEPMSSRIGYQIMEDFADSVTDQTDREKLYVALNQRHPFSSFNHMLHYTAQREKWFEFKRQQMTGIVEDWMKENDIVYKDGRFICTGGMVLEFHLDGDEEIG